MRIKIGIIFLFLAFTCYRMSGQTVQYVTIKGHVTDFGNHPLDSVAVMWMSPQFDVIVTTMTDPTGYYETKVPEGRYFSMGALNLDRYLLAGSKLPPEDLRLEFWGWNFIADRDMVFDMRYHRLEVYGLNVFKVQGGTPAFTVYCRPMSLTRALTYGLPSTGRVRLAPKPENLEVRVTVDGEEVAVLSKQEVEEYWSETESTNAYLLTVDLPKQKNDRPYLVVRVQMKDMENGDTGEATYFYELKEHVR